MKRIYIGLVSFAAIVMPLTDAGAQNMSELMERFAGLEGQVMEKVEKYQREVDQRYKELLGKPWVETKGEDARRNPLDKETPIVPVPFDPSKDTPQDMIKADSDVILTPKDTPSGQAPQRESFEGRKGLDDRMVSLICNGMEISLRCPADGRVGLSGTSENDVAAAWDKMAKVPYDNLFRDLSRVREAMHMSDWSFWQMVEKLSDALYGSACSDEAVLFQSYVMNRFGYLMCLGRSEDDRLHLMMSADMQLIGCPKYTVEGQDYYLFDGTEHKSMFVVRLDMNGERPMQIRMRSDELFYPDYSVSKRYVSKRYPQIMVVVASDKNRMRHYEDYPLYFSNDDVLTAFYYHAMVPHSQEIRETVYPVLRKAINGKTQLESVNMLLDFVQTAFTYEFDEVVWGKERYLYADEIWNYNLSDCEDRSMLFSRLVRDLLGLKVALVYWPGHLSCAVKMDVSVNGTYFECEGEKFVSCDPTYIGAGAGAMMDQVRNLPASLIMLD